MHLPFLTKRLPDIRFEPNFRENKFFKVGIAHDIADNIDEHCCAFKVPFLNEDGSGFFGLYEGHRNGLQAVRIVSATLHEIVLSEILARQEAVNVHASLESAFAKMDARLSAFFDRGLSATICIVRSVKGESILHAANVGDSRAILCRGGKALRLTQEHIRSDEAEKARLAECQSYNESSKRIQGLIRQTRSLGDHALKDWVINTPYCYMTKLTTEDSHIIFLSSNVSSLIYDQEATDLLQGEARYTFMHSLQEIGECSQCCSNQLTCAFSGRTPEAACNAIVKAARERHCNGVATAIVVALDCNLRRAWPGLRKSPSLARIVKEDGGGTGDRGSRSRLDIDPTPVSKADGNRAFPRLPVIGGSASGAAGPRFAVRPWWSPFRIG